MKTWSNLLRPRKEIERIEEEEIKDLIDAREMWILWWWHPKWKGAEVGFLGSIKKMNMYSTGMTAKKLISYDYDPTKPLENLKEFFAAFTKGLISFPLDILKG
ncbi:hypothetical protein C5167_006268 [Papaver somniferum]|uniref:Uncharacterized protein n=1 Tax=Papaver somniferum TaxID=3469 RepID=A0A4Y7JDT5_PAPSO|nr:hypothetical protein C5167_006268 [Papaver somniferum]